MSSIVDNEDEDSDSYRDDFRVTKFGEVNTLPYR